jgi:hypothetical protein
LDSAARLIAINQFAALCGCIPFGDLSANFFSIRGEPRFLGMQLRDRLLNELVYRGVAPSLHIFLDHRFEFGTQADFHETYSTPASKAGYS